MVQPLSGVMLLATTCPQPCAHRKQVLTALCDYELLAMTVLHTAKNLKALVCGRSA